MGTEDTSQVDVGPGRAGHDESAELLTTRHRAPHPKACEKGFPATYAPLYSGWRRWKAGILTSTHVEYLLVGGGITNLAFAQHLASDDLLICEALDDVGGYCQTIKQDGFVWDYSGHFFHFRHKEIEDMLVSRIGPENVRTVTKDSRIRYRDCWIDFPFQKNIHQLPHEDFIDCLVGLFEKDDASPPQNFKAMLYQKFGKGISERFLIPYNEKLYATELAALDVDAMGRFFPYADVKDIVLNFRKADNASYNATFTYPRGGAIEYVRALQQDIPPEQFALQEPVIQIDLQAKTARTAKRTIQYETLISSVPFPRLLAMTALEYDPEIYSYNKVLVFNLGFDKKGPRGLHWVYFPERDVVFYRIGFYDNIFDTDRMSLYVEIGYRADEQIDEAHVTASLERVLADLKRQGIVTDHQLVSHHSIVLDPAYVHITRQSTADVRMKKDILATRGVYSAGRYGSWTYCSIEDNIVEARALADRFRALPRRKRQA
jgi:protoporphyrinogen oxidase